MSTAVDVATILLALAAVYSGVVGLDRLLRLLRPAEDISSTQDGDDR